MRYLARRTYSPGCAVAFLAGLMLQTAAHSNGTLPRLLQVSDLDRIQYLDDAQLSPDGEWVAYTLTTIDALADRAQDSIWMVRWDGTQHTRLTYGPASADMPRWSPDGKFLAFMSARPGEVPGSQVWIMDRKGGEARQLTNVAGALSWYAWSPDSRRLALVMKGSAAGTGPADHAGDPGSPKPWVIRGYRFKTAGGYRGEGPDRRIFLYDIATRRCEPLTPASGAEEYDPVWSPDGREIAFISAAGDEADRQSTADVFIADSKPGSAPRRLTKAVGLNQAPLWSPDGKEIVYAQGNEPKHADSHYFGALAAVSRTGGESRELASDMERIVMAKQFSSDGRSVLVVSLDDRSQYVVDIPLHGGTRKRLTETGMVVSGLTQAAGRIAVTLTTDHAPAEVYALEQGKLRRLTRHNEPLLSELSLGRVEDVGFASTDGTDVRGLITKPPSFQPGKMYPLLLRIHGGPNSQDAHEFDFERQLFAAQGYVVLNVNYRGSAGRGLAYSYATFQGGGKRDVQDLLAGVDHVVATGLADPQRLGVGGWSYGGILTNFVIARDTRFKAAISGAGYGTPISNFGTSRDGDAAELGAPWENVERYLEASYPFFNASRIRTPTLYLGGETDYVVPVAGSEQMYQALRILGVPTELVVYPRTGHHTTRPSFDRDRLQRYLDWYGRYLRPG